MLRPLARSAQAAMAVWGYEYDALANGVFTNGSKPLKLCTNDLVPKLTVCDAWPAKPTLFQLAFSECFDLPPTIGHVYYAVNDARTQSFFCWPVGGGAHRTLLLPTGMPLGDDIMITKLFPDGKMRVVRPRPGWDYSVELNIGPSALLMWIQNAFEEKSGIFERVAATAATLKAIVKFHSVATRQRSLKAPHGSGYKRSVDELYPDGELIAKA
jgi:hypothetical protein